MKCFHDTLMYLVPSRVRRTTALILLLCLTLGVGLVGHDQIAVADDTEDLIQDYKQSYRQLEEAIETIKKAESTSDPDYVDAFQTYKQLTRALPDVKRIIEESGGKVPQEYIDIPTLPGLRQKPRAIDPKPGGVINAEGANERGTVLTAEQRRPWKLGGILTYSAETKQREAAFQKSVRDSISSDWAIAKKKKIENYNDKRWKKYIKDEFEKLYKDYYFVKEYEPVKERTSGGKVKGCSAKINKFSDAELNRRLQGYGLKEKERMMYWFSQIFLHIGKAEKRGTRITRPNLDKFKSGVLKSLSELVSKSKPLPVKIQWTESLDFDKPQSVIIEEYDALQDRIGALLRQRFDRPKDWNSASDDGSPTKAHAWDKSMKRVCKKLVGFEREIVWRLGAAHTDAEIASQKRSLGAMKNSAKRIEKIRMNAFEAAVRSSIADAWFEVAKNVGGGSDFQSSEDAKCAEHMYEKLKGSLSSEVSNQTGVAHDHFYHSLINGLQRSRKLKNFSPHVETEERTDNVYWHALLAEERSINITNVEEKAVIKYKKYYEDGFFKKCYSESETFLEFLTGMELKEYTKQNKARRAVLRRQIDND